MAAKYMIGDVVCCKGKPDETGVVMSSDDGVYKVFVPSSTATIVPVPENCKQWYERDMLPASPDAPKPDNETLAKVYTWAALDVIQYGE